jgi:hypothetical protein
MQAARYLSTSAFSSAAAAKTGWSTTGMPSTIIRHNKSALVNSVGSKPPTFSSVTQNKHLMQAARYLSTSAFSRAAATKTGWSTTGMPSTIIRHNKSALVNSVGSKPPTFSSVTPNKHDPSWEAILARRHPRNKHDLSWEAILARRHPRVASWVARTRQM